MRCTKAQKLISDHIDNLLDGRKLQKLDAHLKGCPLCSNVLEEMELMVNGAKQLSSGSPSEDLWPAIKNQMAHEKRKTVFKYTWKDMGIGFFQYPAKQAFSFATIFIIVGMVSLFYFASPFNQNDTNMPESAALTHFKEAEAHYQLAIKALNHVILDKETTLPPELLEVFKNNLAIIDNSIMNCQAVIRDHPENIEANNYLLICYKKKMDLLNDMRDLIMRSS